MEINPAALIPNTKFETDRASALVQLGFPAAEPALPQMLEWLQDLNWPVAGIFQPFLKGIGRPLAPYVRNILCGDDDGWKYSLLTAVVAQSPELALALKPELERIASKPSSGELDEDVSAVAIEILTKIYCD